MASETKVNGQYSSHQQNSEVPLNLRFRPQLSHTFRISLITCCFLASRRQIFTKTDTLAHPTLCFDFESLVLVQNLVWRRPDALFFSLTELSYVQNI